MFVSDFFGDFSVAGNIILTPTRYLYERVTNDYSNYSDFNVGLAN